MDLIAQLINTKKQATLPLYDYLKELVLYDKLSRSAKFAHIVDSPLMQKRLPLCWAAFNRDAQAYFILNEASTIMQAIASHPLAIFNDLALRYTARERQQLAIIGNVTQHRFTYSSLRQLPYNYEEHGVLYLTEKSLTDGELHLSVIQTTGHCTTVYQGLLRLNDKADKVAKPTVVIAPYRLKEGGDEVTIQTYSVQGNNNYAFAKTRHYKVSMPDPHTFCYQDKATFELQTVTISENDERTLNLKKDDISVMAHLILQYLPRKEAGQHENCKNLEPSA